MPEKKLTTKAKKNSQPVEYDDYFEEEPEPVFDLRRYRMKDTRIIQRMQIEMQKATNDCDLDLYDDVMMRLYKYLLRFVVSVPDEWMAEGHPVTDLSNWDDPEYFDWMGSGRFAMLIQFMAEAQPKRQKK